MTGSGPGAWSAFRRGKAAVANAAILLCALIVAGGHPGEARGEVFWPRITLAPLLRGLSLPVQVTHAGDGTNRLFVVEQGGRIRLARDGVLRDAPFLDISGRLIAGGERGLLGLAFPPGYAAKGHFYVDYTRAPDGATVIARYRLTADPDAADPASEEILLVIDQPFANHNGGQVAFGPDGFLYIGMGDGGSGGDPLDHGQRPDSLLGKMLRIDVESAAVPYGVPSTNPFAATPGFRPEIWALGLRNPWRFAFDRTTGDLYIGDVGQDTIEEIDFQPAGSPGGENYGWRIREGSRCYAEPACATEGLTFPVAEYDHSLGCSVTGGTVYRGEAYPRMQGVYLYGDFCTGRIWGLRRAGTAWQGALLSAAPMSISSFGEDQAGNLYVADYAGGVVHEIVAPNVPPSPPQPVAPDNGATGLPRDVTFSWLPPADPDGGAPTYSFFLDTDPAFSGTVPVPVPADTGRSAIPFGGPSLALVLPGILLPPGIRRSGRRRPGATALAAAALLILGAWAGCGGKTAAKNPVTPAAAVTHAVTGLLPGTTYYWKIVASDGAAESASPVRSFTTGS